MRKIILFCLLALGLSASAPALTVSEGKAAVVEAVIGKVSADQGQGYKKLKLGQSLDHGSSVKTGANGRVSLRLADGSQARIAPNTEMTLKAPETRKGVFTRLLKGTVRFLVAKQASGHSFETELPSAVAAVKGTDPEYYTDGEKQSSVKVFSSGNPVALLLTGKDGKETALKAGDKLSFDGDSFKLEKIDETDIQGSEKTFEGLPEPKLEGGQEEAQGGGEGGQAQGSTQGTEEGQASGEEQASDESLEEYTDEALQEAMNDLYLDGFLERDERTGDIAAGKIVYDRFGERVQVTHFITRADESSVAIASFSLRDGGPNAGVTQAIESSTFNQPLPDNWGEVYKRPLADPANLDAGGYPVYFRTYEYFLAANPAGDSVLVDTSFSAPSWYGSVGGPLDQGYISDIYANGQHLTTLNYWDSDAWNNGNVATNRYFQTPFNWSATAYEGGWSFGFGDNAFPTPNILLTQDLHFIDDNGGVLAHPTFNGSSPLPTVFRGFDANVEMAFRSPLFEGRSIDLIFLPGFFDLYDIIDTRGISSQGGV